LLLLQEKAKVLLKKKMKAAEVMMARRWLLL
jgi:hypothetical protein